MARREGERLTQRGEKAGQVPFYPRDIPALRIFLPCCCCCCSLGFARFFLVISNAFHPALTRINEDS